MAGLRSDKLQTVLYGAGLLVIWAGVKWSSSGWTACGTALIGGGLVLGGYQILAQDPGWELTRSQQVVTAIRGYLQVGFGLAMLLGSLLAVLRGVEGLFQFLSSQPGLVFLATGAVLVGMSVEVALGDGQTMRSGWEIAASIPLRLASLPMLILGLIILAVGVLAILIPDTYLFWIQTAFLLFSRFR